jgi:hypothetical protein
MKNHGLHTTVQVYVHILYSEHVSSKKYNFQYGQTGCHVGGREYASANLIEEHLCEKIHTTTLSPSITHFSCIIFSVFVAFISWFCVNGHIVRRWLLIWFLSMLFYFITIIGSDMVIAE